MSASCAHRKEKTLTTNTLATDGLLTGRERASVGTRVGTSRRLAAQLSTGTSAATEVSHPLIQLYDSQLTLRQGDSCALTPAADVEGGQVMGSEIFSDENCFDWRTELKKTTFLSVS